MDIQLSCQHTTLTDALREAVNDRFNRLAGHTSRPTSAHVVLTANGGAEPHKAEATLLIDGKPLHASASDKNMYAALDALVSRLDRRMRKDKTARLATRAVGSPGHSPI